MVAQPTRGIDIATRLEKRGLAGRLLANLDGAAVEQNPDPVEWFVLNAEANVEVDLTALDAVDQLRQDLDRRGIVFGMARVTWHLREALQAAGMLDKIGADHIFMTLPTAVEAYRNRRTA